VRRTLLGGSPAIILAARTMGAVLMRLRAASIIAGLSPAPGFSAND